MNKHAVRNIILKNELLEITGQIKASVEHIYVVKDMDGKEFYVSVFLEENLNQGDMVLFRSLRKTDDYPYELYEGVIANVC